MPTFYLDETGFTGEDLMAAEQPVFVQATTDLTNDEATTLLSSLFPTQAQEVKYNRIRRSPAGRQGVLTLVKSLSANSERAGTWVANKEFSMVTMLVEWWMEPLAHKCGLNMYENGANLATANMLYITLGGFWPVSFRRNLLLHFQRLFRSRTAERFDECKKFVESALRRSDANQKEILRYLWPSFELLGMNHVSNLPPRVLDLALPGLILLGHTWRARHPGPWQLVHDNSTNMAKQRWLWDALSSADMPQAKFGHPHVDASFPMNVVTSRFADSVSTPQLQICDVLAGATSEFVRRATSSTDDREFVQALEQAGITAFVREAIWPSADVTPEALGRKGWDGSKAVDWIAAQMAQRNIQAPSR